MEFYLVDDLECDLTVFHPYRTLLALCGLESGTLVGEAGEVGAGIEEGERYWGTGECKIELDEGGLQMAWYVAPTKCVVGVNDELAIGSSSTTHTARTSACCTRRS